MNFIRCLPIALDNKDKTTVISPYCKFCFTVMSFGLRNAPATFQWMMDGLLLNHTDYSSVYINDVAFFSNSWEEHQHHLNTIFDVLRSTGLTIQEAKAQLSTTFCVLLGHRIREGYIPHTRLKSQQLGDFIQSCFTEEVRAYIGIINYNRKFFSTHVDPIYTTQLKPSAAPQT